LNLWNTHAIIARMDTTLLKHLGAALYVCEGTKARRDYRTKNGFIYSIELTNSNPKIIQLFSRFLRDIIGADWSRVKGQIFKRVLGGIIINTD